MSGATILITGAAERAGAEIALAFASRGYDVHINHWGQADAAETVIARCRDSGSPGRVRAIEADVTDPEAARAMVDEVVARSGRLDVLLHNASTFRPRPFAELTPDDVDSSFGVTLRGPLFLSQAAARVMTAQGSGRILAILGNSLSEAWPDLVPHIVAKTGLGRLIEQLAVALSPHVACNSVAPTQFFRSDDGVNDELRRRRGEDPVGGSTTLVKGIPVRETTLPDVIEVLLFLATAPASLTGATIRVDGGRALI